MFTYKNPAVRQAPLVTEKERSSEHTGGQSGLLYGALFSKKIYEVAFMEQATVFLALKQQLDLSTQA